MTRRAKQPNQKLPLERSRARERRALFQRETPPNRRVGIDGGLCYDALSHAYGLPRFGGPLHDLESDSTRRHAPGVRYIVETLSDWWEVRLMSGDDPRRLASRGYWHFQLWHPVARVSILTPSRLTQGFYEACPETHWLVQSSSYPQLLTAADGLRGAHLPTATTLLVLEQRWLHDLVGCLA